MCLPEDEMGMGMSEEPMEMYSPEMHMDMDMDMGKEHMEMHNPMMHMHMHESMCLAHAYVPWQFYHKAFSPREALCKGTLFPELFGVYKPPM
jgi:hypothetical protein